MSREGLLNLARRISALLKHVRAALFGVFPLIFGQATSPRITRIIS
jgi:hypothetical protein